MYWNQLFLAISLLLTTLSLLLAALSLYISAKITRTQSILHKEAQQNLINLTKWQVKYESGDPKINELIELITEVRQHYSRIRPQMLSTEFNDFVGSLNKLNEKCVQFSFQLDLTAEFQLRVQEVISIARDLLAPPNSEANKSAKYKTETLITSSTLELLAKADQLSEI